MITGTDAVTAYDGRPPEQEEARTISGGPLYAAEDVVALARGREVHFWTRGAIEDAQKWELDVAAASDLVEVAVQLGRYHGSEWCRQRPNGPWAACDVYIASQREVIPATGRSVTVSWYLKFGVARTGALLLLVSNHPEGT